MLTKQSVPIYRALVGIHFTFSWKMRKFGYKCLQLLLVVGIEFKRVEP